MRPAPSPRRGEGGPPCRHQRPCSPTSSASNANERSEMNSRVEIGRVAVGKLQVARVLHDFIETEALPGSGITTGEFWNGLAALIHELSPLNRQFLDLRNELQARIDDFHRVNVDASVDPAAYERFL